MTWHIARAAFPKARVEPPFLKRCFFLTLLLNSSNLENDFLLLNLILTLHSTSVTMRLFNQSN